MVVGFSYFSFGFAVLLLYSVVRTIPRSLEEAAAAHGAGRLRTMLRVVLPLSLPGLAAAFLTVFNLCMGAFTSAALLGAGRVLTLPVLIERTILAEVRYGLGGALGGVADGVRAGGQPAVLGRCCGGGRRDRAGLLAGLLLAFVAAYLLAPLVVVVGASFSGGETGGPGDLLRAVPAAST